MFFLERLQCTTGLQKNKWRATRFYKKKHTYIYIFIYVYDYIFISLYIYIYDIYIYVYKVVFSLQVQQDSGVDLV